MEILELSLPSSNLFVQTLLNKQLHTDFYFHYDIHNQKAYSHRVEELKSRSFKREELVNCLLQYNERFQSQTVNNNIEKLRDPESTAVIGGQQAGLLTGPLYTIHKILSVLSLAKQQEKALNKPVVPVFWIAGEDHDFAEINHLFIQDKYRVKKKSISQMPFQKSSVSNLAIDSAKCRQWIDDIFESFGETNFTNEIKAQVLLSLEKSETFVDFFEWLIMDLFKNQGLILVNSAHPELRKLEIDYFQQLIQHNESIEKAVREQQDVMKKNGFSPIIEMTENSANLFYEHEGERLLLQKENGSFVHKDTGLCIEESEIFDLLSIHPERFSNNVVTRPIMQECLFPTLAFIAGPGELTYWGELKKAFEVLNLKMSPVVPRLNITLLERAIESEINEMNLDLLTVMTEDLEEMKEAWVDKRRTVAFQPLAEEIKKEIDNLHARLREAAIAVDGSLEGYVQKNAGFIQSQIALLEKTVEKSIRLQNYNGISKFERIANSIKPNRQPQERIWNIYYYLNKYGSNILQDLTELPYSFNYQHKVVKI
ncbi:bacillithiol biosynthesis cysteine-adding enzyme BshC [Metabacillus sp. RGM 3146]|uniref:bacillithiol biosynthesis cysteine-adding enzyme BshC n=1 Tax=Metabacillus sp. RGM 3146 TaxID=3401092 RepID=UPI003B9A959F